jgi:hypothetical protein
VRPGGGLEVAPAHSLDTLYRAGFVRVELPLGEWAVLLATDAVELFAGFSQGFQTGPASVLGQRSTGQDLVNKTLAGGWTTADVQLGKVASCL